ncbi:MAG: DinB family protein [Flavobacteriales bacterium]|jgi:hypothetical protein|nr:DinB family protein [Flavobacteriales bacterium]
MKRSEIEIVPDYFLRYINLVPDAELMDVLPTGGIDLYQNELEKLKAIGLKTYAAEKWTIPELIEHLMDTERIFLNRSLRFVRQDTTPLPGYDENEYAKTSRANERSLEDLLEEYEVIRSCTNLFFKNLNREQLLATGEASGLKISVLAMGFIQIGHPIHHFNVIKERYFPLITQ